MKLKQWFTKPQSKLWFYYGLLALLIMGPMLLAGYVLAFDMVFTPNLPAPTDLSSHYVFSMIVHVLNFVIPSQFIEKLIIFGILVLSGAGMHRLINIKSVWPKYFAGVLYVVNPFTYERWMAGHYLLLAGYALLPFLMKGLFGFIELPNKKNLIRLALWYLAITLVSIHVLVLGGFIGLIFIAGHLISKPTQPGYRKKLAGQSGLLLLLGLAGNSYWLVSTLAGRSEVAKTLDHISSQDFAAFTTNSNQHLGLFVNVATMYGFWLEQFNRYVMPNANIFLWLGLFAILAALVISGARRQLRAGRVQAVCMLIVGLVGFIIASGVDAPLIGHFTRWFISDVPFMKGFREPEKFSALLVLVYCYFGAYGVDAVIIKAKSWPKELRDYVPAVLVLVPLLYVSTMLFGFTGQLKAVDYPRSWYSFNDSLKTHPATGKILFLPWHEYMSYDFTNNIIANPAPQFFAGQVIAGTNAEFGEVYDEAPPPDSVYIENYILAQTNRNDLGTKLAAINVQYVLLSQGFDHAKYGFLNRQSDLKQISSHPGLSVYLNTAYGAQR